MSENRQRTAFRENKSGENHKTLLFCGFTFNPYHDLMLDYVQYQWAQEDTHSTIASPRPQPDWERRPSQAFSDDSKMSSFKSFKSSTASTESTNIHDKKRRSSFKKSSTLLNG